MWQKLLLIAVAAIICLCAADVSHINHEPPKDVLLPFNDLLPPLADESSTEAAPLATKPTKKSYYHQQQAKESQHGDDKPSQQSEQKPFLDLLPPFAEASTIDAKQTQAEGAVISAEKPVASSPPTAGTASRVPYVARPQPLHTHVAQRHSNAPSATQYTTAKTQLSADLIAKYATYFQFTTPRPRRGPLPTLTPFPNHIKK